MSDEPVVRPCELVLSSPSYVQVNCFRFVWLEHFTVPAPLLHLVGQDLLKRLWRKAQRFWWRRVDHPSSQAQNTKF
jgi:hypothetical protein